MEVAALARIEEIRNQNTRTEGSGEMSTDQATDAQAKEAKEQFRAGQRAAWSLGDYQRFASEMTPNFGPELVAACGISAGQRVLDVAAGSGRVAIEAAEAGAKAVASDLTPEHFEAGRREARERGVELEWVEADAEALPFGDGEFDVVTSAAGAIFAPDHEAVADELLRVCRPGGTIGMINFTPEGLAADFFGTLADYMPPPPPGALPPLMWGSEEHLRELFGERVSSLKLSRKEYIERSPGDPREYVEFFKQTFGPVVATYASLADDPERAAALDRDFLEYATGNNQGGPDGPAEYRYEYLLVVARRAEA